MSFAKFPSLAIINHETLDIIRKLSQDPNNQVVIISGRDWQFIEKHFEDVNVSLVAGHGYYIKQAAEIWVSTISTDELWKESVLPIINQCVSRCYGTFIEEKTDSIAWHYRNADSEFAELRLHALKDDLTEIIRHKTNL